MNLTEFNKHKAKEAYMNRNKQLEPWQEKTLINQGDYLANIVQAALQTALNAQFEQSSRHPRILPIGFLEGGLSYPYSLIFIGKAPPPQDNSVGYNPYLPLFSLVAPVHSTMTG